ncbi:MAG: protein translocase subunit SecF [Candidatus Woesearchaeota archaeon]
MSEGESYKGLKGIYFKYYKQLLVLPLILIVASFAVIAIHYANTGEFFKKDVSLKGGVTITISQAQNVDLASLESYLRDKLPAYDVTVRSVGQTGGGVIVEAGVTEDSEINSLLAEIENKIGALNKDDYAIQTMGSSLGKNFMREAMTALLLAFIAMSIVVFIYFRNFVPSILVIWAVFADIVCAFAAMILLDVHISTAGIAAFLMLIGYSVDTDILLTTRVLKSTEGTVFERVWGAGKTGLTMTITALIAVITGLLIGQSDVIRQIMLVLMVGLLFDIFHTWITNAGTLRWYMERKQV